jgi:hypothetical protein
VTRSNRIGNRIIILLAGLVSVAVGVALALPRFGSYLTITAPTLSAPQPAALWIGLGACVGVIILSLLWMLTRGRGRTGTLLNQSDQAGSTTIDVHVAADLLSDALAGSRDVASIGSGAYRMRGQTMLSLRLVARNGAHLPTLIQSASNAVDELDEVLERRIPVLLHIVSERGVRTIRTR